MAMGKAVVTARTPGSNEGLIDGNNVLLCTVADPADLARSIKRLKENTDLREHIERNAVQTFIAVFGEKAVQSALQKVLEEVRS
jgi:glycosyltransferase involved in cell wall biosynthesis